MPQIRATEPVDTLFGLLVSYDDLKPHLVEAEYRGREWILARRADARSKRVALSDRCPDTDEIIALHRVMFERVFRWAGSLRTKQTTPGVEPI